MLGVNSILFKVCCPQEAQVRVRLQSKGLWGLPTVTTHKLQSTLGDLDFLSKCVIPEWEQRRDWEAWKREREELIAL